MRLLGSPSEAIWPVRFSLMVTKISDCKVVSWYPSLLYLSSVAEPD